MPDEVAIVTGASRGLGKAIALDLAQRGATVALAARRREDCLAAVEEIEQAGGTASAYACDVVKSADVENLVTAVAQNHGRIDILVNNAGTIDPIALIGECDTEAWRTNLEVNVCGPFYAVQAVLPHFAASGGGVIVNVSSGAAHTPLEGWSAYCASKAALAMLTRSIALENAKHGVRCYGFQPGVVDTQMQATIRSSGINEVSRIPRGQLAAAQVPARLIALLCLARPAGLNGQDLSIRDQTAMAQIEEAGRARE